MTSMPASRRARAITLAPRSCPSRPGLATSTRIFMSAIRLHLITAATRGHNERGDSYGLDGFDIQTSPHVPAGHTAVWLPCPGDLLHILRLWELALFVVFFKSDLDAVVSGRQDIQTAQGEDEEHVGCPDANALDLSQVLDHLFVGQLMQVRKIEQAGRSLGSEIFQVR